MNTGLLPVPRYSNYHITFFRRRSWKKPHRKVYLPAFRFARSALSDTHPSQGSAGFLTFDATTTAPGREGARPGAGLRKKRPI